MQSLAENCFSISDDLVFPSPLWACSNGIVARFILLFLERLETGKKGLVRDVVGFNGNATRWQLDWRTGRRDRGKMSCCRWRFRHPPYPIECAGEFRRIGHLFDRLGDGRIGEDDVCGGNLNNIDNQAINRKPAMCVCSTLEMIFVSVFSLPSFCRTFPNSSPHKDPLRTLWIWILPSGKCLILSISVSLVFLLRCIMAL